MLFTYTVPNKGQRAISFATAQVYMKLEVSDHEIMTHNKLNWNYKLLVVIEVS